MTVADVSEKVGHWRDWSSRRTFRCRPQDWPRSAYLGAACDEPTPDGQDTCSREKGHPGRHMASYGPSGGFGICSAWPGLHAPCPADLTGKVETGRG